MVFLECKKCGYIWNYCGGSNWFAACPRCHTSVKVIEKYKLIPIENIKPDQNEIKQ